MVTNKNNKPKISMPDGLAGLVRAAQEQSNPHVSTQPVQETPVQAVPQQPASVAPQPAQPLVSQPASAVEAAVSPTPRQKRGPVPVQHIEADNSWDLFKGYVEQYKKDTTKGKEIWINEDIRYELDKMKTASRSSMKLKTMVNAMLHTFMDLHREEIEDLLSQG